MDIYIWLLFLLIIIAVLIYIDANKLKRSGIKITPLVWSLSIFIFSLLILMFYLIMRYAVWKVQLGAIQDSNVPKNRSTVKIIMRLSIILVIFILFLVAGGCHLPFVAKFVHNKIKIGMTTREIVDILRKYKGYHRYEILILNEEDSKECNRIKPEYEKCINTSDVVDCFVKFQSYRDRCEGKLIHNAEEFIRSMDDIANKKFDYAIYEAKTIVLFMGPVFVHNDFKIHFNSQGRVESITPVRHWD